MVISVLIFRILESAYPMVRVSIILIQELAHTDVFDCPNIDSENGLNLMAQCSIILIPESRLP